MRSILLVLVLALSPLASSEALSEWLTENVSGYFPRDGVYSEFQKICNPSTCFRLVSVTYVSSSNKGMVRLAVFNNSGKYLGSYSGFQDAPRYVRGSKLYFHKSDFGSYIDFREVSPPKSAYIDGELFEFEEVP